MNSTSLVFAVISLFLVSFSFCSSNQRDEVIAEIVAKHTSNEVINIDAVATEIKSLFGENPELLDVDSRKYLREKKIFIAGLVEDSPSLDRLLKNHGITGERTITVQKVDEILKEIEKNKDLTMILAHEEDARNRFLDAFPPNLCSRVILKMIEMGIPTTNYHPKAAVKIKGDTNYRIKLIQIIAVFGGGFSFVMLFTTLMYIRKFFRDRRLLNEKVAYNTISNIQ